MRIFIIGINGRMGKNLQQYLLQKNTDYCGVDINDKDCDLTGVDVIVDFSSKDALYNNLLLAQKNNLPIVVATTGHDDNAYALMKHYSKWVLA